MSDASFRSVDLNLLRALDALLTGRSVSDAAKALGLSQPAVSHALQRLRVVLDDALLVRTSTGMQLTPAAHRLAPRVRGAIAGARAVFEPQEAFEPRAARRSFTLAMPEHVQVSVARPLVAMLRDSAPGIELRFVSLPNDVERALEVGECDLALSLDVPASANLMRQKLIDARIAYALRAGHPMLRRPLTRAAVLDQPHVIVVPTSGAAQASGRKLAVATAAGAHVLLRTPSLMVGLMVIKDTDAVLSAAYLALKPFREPFDLVLFKPSWLPAFKAYQHWHRLQDHDAGQRWMRKAIHEIYRRLASDAND